MIRQAQSSGREALRSLTIAMLRNNAALRKRLQVVGPLCGTALAGVCQVAARLATSGSWPAIFNAISGALIIVVVVIAILLTLSDKSGPEALAEAEKAQDEVVSRDAEIERQQAEIDALAEDFSWLTTLLATTIALRDVVGDVLTSGPGDQAAQSNRLGTMLDLALSNKFILFGIEDERWNFGIYLPDERGETLLCKACRRRDRADENAEHRAWPKGMGHIGRAFGEAREFVAEDVKQPAVEAYFVAPPPLGRPDDSDRYRSIAALPILIGSPPPLGVLVATSDMPGRFKPPGAIGGGGPDTVEPLRALAAALAMLLTVTDLTRNGGPDRCQIPS